MNVLDKFLNDSLLLESKCGEFGDYYIYVNSDDSGNIPHFHMKDTNTDGKKFHTCIQLTKNNYFLHEGKTKVISSSKIRKELCKLLKSKPTKIPKEIQHIKPLPKTVWEMMCYLWNTSYRSQYINLKTTKIPDYTIIHPER